MVSTFTALDASQYEQMMGRWSRILARQFIAFAGIGDHDKVLDVGCGTGSLTLGTAGGGDRSGDRGH